MLVEDKRERDCAEYTADCIGALLQRFFRYSGAEDFTFPLFTDRYAEKKEEPKQSADEIKEHLLALLTE